MVFPSFRKKRRDVTASRLIRKHRPGETWRRRLLSLRGLALILAFFGYVAAVLMIGFVGLTPPLPQILPDQKALSRVVAEFPFEFVSRIETQNRRDEAVRRTPPIYRLDLEGFAQFNGFIDDLTELSRLAPSLSQPELEEAIQGFLAISPFPVDPVALEVFFAEAESVNRNRYLSQGLAIVWEIYQRGVVGQETLGRQSAEGLGGGFLQVEAEGGLSARISVQRLNRALIDLRIALGEMSISDSLFPALFEIMRHGIRDNLVFDAERSQQRINEALAQVESVLITVAQGETLIEPGSIASALEIERFNAYRQIFREMAESGPFWDSNLRQRTFLVIGVILLGLILLTTTIGWKGLSQRKVVLMAVAVLLNLTLIRLVLMLGETAIFADSAVLTAVLPYAAPLAFGALIAAILAGSSAGVLVALLVSFLSALMQGNDIELLLASFLSGLAGVWACRELRVRTRLVRAALISGLTMAVFITVNGLFTNLDPSLIIQQVALALGVAMLSGLIIVGILPYLESAFKFTTDISLLELTDFNHPLLRRMQIEAPGSYHHSLMVANLSEKAAAEIGANPLLCRACALYHDIGKLVKPEYFTENQSGGINPHIERNPSMSALVIKAHVKEGVEMARQWKLPRIFIDIIRQHHGTTLIKYFYIEALQRQRKDTTLPLFPNAHHLDMDKVEEMTYRYDGPKPRFKESAIIFFADSVEAASRSLRKVTSQSVEELLDKIFQQRIEDHQLDDCPITFQEIALIKKSFLMTLLNMLHSRIEYPDEEKAKSAAATSRNPTAIDPTPVPEVPPAPPA
jgi:putative nucleotidyltransferase with HDIG domain